MLILIAVFFTFFLYSAIGRRILTGDLWVISLVGLSAVGLIVGIAANVCAGCIPYLFFGLFFLSLILSCLDLYKNRNNFVAGFGSWVIDALKNPVYYFAGLVSVTTLLLNVFNSNILNIDGEDYFVFNTHESYFGGLITEMWQSDYFGRLRIRNNFDYQWSRYHFFNSSCFGALLVLAPDSYLSNFKTELLAAFLIGYLSIIGKISAVEKTGSKIKRLLLSVAITALLSSLFYSSYSWSVRTSAFFSFVGMFHLAIAAWKGSTREVICLAIVVASSTSRSLVEVVLGGFLFVAVLIMIFSSEERGFSRILRWCSGYRRPGSWFLGFLAGSFGYGLLTLLSGHVPKDAGARSDGLGGWILENPPFLLKDALMFFGLKKGDWLGWRPFGDLSARASFAVAFLGLVLILFGFTWSVFRQWFRWAGRSENRKSKDVSISIGLFFGLGFLCLGLFCAKPSRGTVYDFIGQAHVIFALFCLIAYLSYRFSEIGLARRLSVLFVLSVFCAATFCSFSVVVPEALKGPMALSDINALVFAVLFIVFCSVNDVRLVGVLSCLLALLVFSMPPRINTATYFNMLDQNTVFVKVSDYAQFKSEETNGKQALAVKDFNLDPIAVDYFAASYGFRVSGDPSFLTNGFLPEKKVRENKYWLEDGHWQKIHGEIFKRYKKGENVWLAGSLQH